MRALRLQVAKIMGKGFEQCLASHLATLFEPDDDRDEETLAGLARNKLTSIDNIKTVTKSTFVITADVAPRG